MADRRCALQIGASQKGETDGAHARFEFAKPFATNAPLEPAGAQIAHLCKQPLASVVEAGLISWPCEDTANRATGSVTFSRACRTAHSRHPRANKEQEATMNRTRVPVKLLQKRKEQARAMVWLFQTGRALRGGEICVHPLWILAKCSRKNVPAGSAFSPAVLNRVLDTRSKNTTW